MMNKNLKWYDSGNKVTNALLLVIVTIIICSQSFVLGQDLSLQLFGSIINHNSVYLLLLVYFIFIKFKFGKKYFNYLNVALMLLYSISTFTSLLTVIQSISLDSVLDFIINLIIIIYLFHTMFRDTRVWKEYKLSKSPFNELSNEWLFYSITLVSLVLLVVNLISTVVVSGVIISILDTIFVILFARYIYLYRAYLDSKKIDSDNEGNFDKITENIKESVDNATDKVKKAIDDADIDDKLNNIKDKVVDVAGDVKDNIDSFIEKNEIDKKVEAAKDKISDVVEDVKENIDEKLNKKDDSGKKEESNEKSSDKQKKNSDSKKRGDK